jgi:glucans biosynthesis protein
MHRGKGVIMDIETALFLRKRRVARLGIAPLTSMYWYSETAKPTAIDWRPEVHDSDGLALLDGRGRARLPSAEQSRRRHAPPPSPRIRAASACCSATASSATTSTA